MSLYKTDAVVIGAGVIGLAVARVLALSGREVMLLEANAAIGIETSSRNSEVLHAGIYYPPASIKAKTCINGHRLLEDFCRERGIAHARCGKLIVATDECRIPQLEHLHRNAIACGVNSLEAIDQTTLQQMEPGVRGVAALWSPASGIIDSHALMLALRADLEAAAGNVVLNARVSAGEIRDSGCRLTVASGAVSLLEAPLVVNAAGLQATALARSIRPTPAATIPRQYYARGHYFNYAGQPPCTHLVYPLPAVGGLGVHATLDLAGQLRFGPDSEYCDAVDYRFDTSRKARFAAAIRQWYPTVDESRLQPGYVGVRPKLAGPDDEFADFCISGPAEHGCDGLIHLYGIESPGLTASLALAEEVLARLTDN